MRRYSIAVLLLIVASVAWAGSSPSVKVQTTPLKKHSMDETITAFGVVRPDPEAQTTRDATYTAFVRKLNVTLGQPVKKGDPLLTLRTAPSAHSNYLTAQANVRFARQDVTRQRKLLKQRLATHANVSSAEQQLAQAEAAFAAQKALGTGQKTRVVTAPFSGIVSKLPIDPGNQVKSGTLLFQLARRDRLRVALGIEPDEVNRVKQGMPVQVVSLFGSGRGVTSHITVVNAVVDPKTRLVNAIAPLRGAKAQPFLPGMRVQGLLKIATHNTLAVPRSAVLRDKHGAYLFVVRNGKAHRINVTTGLERNGLVAIKSMKSDVKIGAPIVVQGNYELSDGMAVRQGS
ncbi:MAG: efflux RND transporter periplasmic adaptor subunit [Salinisphaera sp.]|jgi:membrane fusion protein (multidrug efflux system)|nr:efflux RND transporter periplasmic adaptor subunit [Salinisphaera sp.]